jgi:hypothetical protein
VILADSIQTDLNIFSTLSTSPFTLLLVTKLTLATRVRQISGLAFKAFSLAQTRTAKPKKIKKQTGTGSKNLIVAS